MMHIYYYFKDGFYYVMNENYTLERYKVTNNIEFILKQENLIKYFTWELNEEENKFNFKPLEELTYLEKQNIYNAIPAIIILEYSIFKSDTIPLVLTEASILNVINRYYKKRKDTLQTGDKLLEDLLRELITNLNNDLQKLKEISHYEKEIVPLSELDTKCPKTKIESIDNIINHYKDEMDIKMDLDLNPQNIFANQMYEIYLKVGIDDKRELEYQKMIYQIKNYFLKKCPEKVTIKLDIEKKEKIKNYLFNIANGSMSIGMILELLNNHNIEFLNYNQEDIRLLIILLNITCYMAYHKINEELKNTPNPTLKLEKKDK